MSITIAMSLDLKGLSCPLPIIKTAKAMKDLAPGQLLEVLRHRPRFGARLQGLGQGDRQPARRVERGSRRLPLRPQEEGEF